MTMWDERKQRKIDYLKRNGLSVDIFSIFLTVWLIWHASIGFQLINPFDHCSPEIFIPHGVDENDELVETTWNMCANAVGAKILLCVILSYISLCAALIASPLKSTPILYFSGIYFLGQDGQRPSLLEGIRLMLFSRYFLPVYMGLLYAFLHDFTLNVNELWSINILVITLFSALQLFERVYKPELTCDERVSGLRFHFTEKKHVSIDKQLKRYHKKFYDPYDGAFFFISRLIIFEILLFLVMSYFTFNVLREGSAPVDYAEIVYERDAPDWENNAYFALAGLDAPKEIYDHYEYGREKVIFHAARYAEFLKKVTIPYTHAVPHISYSLFQPDKEEQKLSFDKDNFENIDCFYDLEIQASNSSCPSIETTRDVMNKNKLVWNRFKTILNYQNFTIPDHYLNEAFDLSLFSNLVRLNAAYILYLQSQNEPERAMQEWLRYTKLYLQMASTRTNLVNKAFFLVALNIQMKALEAFLYHDPDLAQRHGDEIQDLLNIKALDYFQMDSLMADDWRLIEPQTWTLSGGSNYRNEIYRCFEENKRIAHLPPSEILKADKFCKTGLNEDELWLSLQQSGIFFTNLTYNFLRHGLDKGVSLVKNAQYKIVEFRVISAAIELIRNKVPSGAAQGYLNALPENLQDPFNNQPFMWDAENQEIYYTTLKGTDDERTFRFKVELTR